MAKYNLSVHYDGEGLQENRIPVADLAPSLIALSDTFQQIQKLVNPNEQTLSLDIVASEKGSFIIDLVLASGSDLISKAIDLLNNNNSVAIANLAAYGDILFRLINLIKKSFKHKIKKKQELQNGNIKITFDDGTKITIPEETLDAYQNVNIRKSIQKSISPLTKDGIERINFYHNKNQQITIAKNEYSCFDIPELEQELGTVETTKYLQIENIAFEHGKWKFSDGSNHFFANIEDKNFLSEVKKNQQLFGSTDTLKVNLRTKQYIDKSGNLKTENTIVKVLEHNIGGQQLKLDIIDAGSSKIQNKIESKRINKNLESNNKGNN